MLGPFTVKKTARHRASSDCDRSREKLPIACVIFDSKGYPLMQGALSTLCNFNKPRPNNMNTTPENDPRLGALLRDARPAPDLPPRFQQSVWRRIETADARPATPHTSWLEQLVIWLLQPRHALVGATALVLVGITLGIIQGGSMAHELARDRYLALVSPGVTR